MLRHSGIFLLLAASLALVGFAPAQKECRDALGETVGKICSEGAVFINGKYFEGPYKVIRSGNVICIRAGGKTMPVTGPLCSWEDLLKTQFANNLIREGDDEEKPEPAVEKAAEPEVKKAPEPEPKAVKEVETGEEALKDLFGDDSDGEKKEPEKSEVVEKAKSATSEPPKEEVPQAAAKSKAEAKLRLKGEFKMTSKAKRVQRDLDKKREAYDRTLRMNGLLIFGDKYDPVSGNSTSLGYFVDSLVKLQDKAKDLNSFRNGLRACYFPITNEQLGEDLFEFRKKDRWPVMQLKKKLEEAKKFGLVQ